MILLDTDHSLYRTGRVLLLMLLLFVLLLMQGRRSPGKQTWYSG